MSPFSTNGSLFPNKRDCLLHSIICNAAHSSLMCLCLLPSIVLKFSFYGDWWCAHALHSQQLSHLPSLGFALFFVWKRTWTSKPISRLVTSSCIQTSLMFLSSLVINLATYPFFHAFFDLCS